ncbi:hypothetical protein [Natrinema thermotolerans]
MRRRAFLATAGTVSIAGCTASEESDEPTGTDRVTAELSALNGELEAFESVSVLEHEPPYLFESRTELEIGLAQEYSVVELAARWDDGDESLLGSNSGKRERLAFDEEIETATLEYSDDIERIFLELSAIDIGIELAVIDIEYASEGDD